MIFNVFRVLVTTLCMALGAAAFASPESDEAVLGAYDAYRDLIRWMVSDYGFDEIEAYFLCTQAGRLRVGNMVDPKYTLGASMLKSYLS